MCLSQEEKEVEDLQTRIKFNKWLIFEWMYENVVIPNSKMEWNFHFKS
jgi:hypothetical protein